MKSAFSRNTGRRLLRVSQKQMGVLLVVVGAAAALLGALGIGQSGFGWLLRVVGIVVAAAGMVALLRPLSSGDAGPRPVAPRSRPGWRPVPPVP
jgi:peptidoglycan/LPS O-acetylase OafA/YrhL